MPTACYTMSSHLLWDLIALHGPCWGDESHFMYLFLNMETDQEEVSWRDVSDIGTCGNDLGARLSAGSQRSAAAGRVSPPASF